MLVPVMDVRVVRVSVDKFFVPVPVRVRFARRIIRAVDVLLMLVVCVQVLMLHRLVPVFVSVKFSEMKPDAERHEHGGGDEADHAGRQQR